MGGGGGRARATSPPPFTKKAPRVPAAPAMFCRAAEWRRRRVPRGGAGLCRRWALPPPGFAAAGQPSASARARRHPRRDPAGTLPACTRRGAHAAAHTRAQAHIAVRAQAALCCPPLSLGSRSVRVGAAAGVSSRVRQKLHKAPPIRMSL